MKTYGVKILYRMEAGEDVFYEESILRIQADSFDGAFSKAEAYARCECMDEHINPYGERVKKSVVGTADCVEAFAEVSDVQEVYSRIMSGAAQGERKLQNALFDCADCAQMLSLRVQEYNEPWTRREMRVLLDIYNQEPVSLIDIEHHVGGDVQGEIGSLLRKELIEEIDQSDDHGRIRMYRTSERFILEFAAEEE